MARLIVAVIFLTLFSSCQQIFFYLTTMTNEPVEVNVSPPETRATERQNKNDITILLYNENNIYAYSGTNINNGKKYNYNSIRNFLKEKKTKTGNQLRVIIKAGTPGNYKNTVNILDQMAINDIKKYALADPTGSEKNFIKELK